MKVATCIGCGCTDNCACRGGCWWERVDYNAGVGVCSTCTHMIKAWDNGLRAKLAPTHLAMVERLQVEERIMWKGTSGTESRALIALAKKGVACEVFQPYGNTYFTLPN